MQSALKGKSARITAIALSILAGLIVYTIGSPSFAAITGAGTIRVLTTVSGGTADTQNFTLTVRKDGSSAALITASGGDVTFGMSPGAYTITQTGPSGYSTLWSGDCGPQGHVTITDGSVLSCTITNTWGTPPPPPPPSGGNGGSGGNARGDRSRPSRGR